MSTSVTDDIATWLADKGIGTKGTSIFRGYLPPTPVDCLGVFASGGSAADLVGNIDNPSVQVLVRASSYTNAETVAYNVFNNLHGVTETTIGNTRYLLIEALQDPVFVGQNENGHYLFSVNFRIMRENTSHVY